MLVHHFMGWGSITRCRYVLLLAGAPMAVLTARGAVSFEREVMAVISKAGCNAGACHGNLNGKGGFKLSLRGENPGADFEALVTQKPGRRVDPAAVDRSLILRKPTLEADHEGGRRFDTNSVEYRILRDWIAEGALRDPAGTPALTELRLTPDEAILTDPLDRVSLRAEAVFADGSHRDVTRLATYEPNAFSVAVTPEGDVVRTQFGEVTVGVRYLQRQAPVRLAFLPARPDFVWADPAPGNVIDVAVFAKLRSLRMNPSAVCDDATFLRRASLDLLGKLPTAGEARAFAGDAAADKRARLIDRWLERPEFADFWALHWADLLRVEERVLDPRGVEVFHRWIRESVAANKPLDVFVREILTARGSTYEVAPANYYRALRDPTARSEAVAQVFLGTRIGCARCHNHPYERWSQDDYYRFGALFDGLDYEIKENNNPDKFDTHQFVGEQIVRLTDKPVLNDPRSGRPPVPGLLTPDAPALRPDEDRFVQLAAWVTSPEHPLFARVQANRVWALLLGRGLVDPVDDFRRTNPASIPALLDQLASELSGHGFDMKHLIRTICASRTYQLSSEPNETNADDAANFSHAIVRRLSAEVAVDAVAQFLGGVPPAVMSERDRRPAVQMPGVRLDSGKEGREMSALLQTLGKPKRQMNSELERANDTSLGQVFALTSGPIVARWLAEPDNRLGQLLASGIGPEAIVSDLYWSALTRPPTDVEAAVCRGRVAAALQPDDRRRVVEDLAWALLNAKEFILRR